MLLLCADQPATSGQERHPLPEERLSLLAMLPAAGAAAGLLVDCAVGRVLLEHEPPAMAGSHRSRTQNVWLYLIHKKTFTNRF
jgi:hypothetical protein